MKCIMKGIILSLLLGMSALLYASCSSPAAPPAAPAEIPFPVALKFVEPEDLSVDVSTLQPAVGVGEFQNEIISGAEGMELVEIFLGSSLNNIGQIEVPTDELVTTFEATMTFISDGNYIEEYLLGTREVRIDFGDFDFDGDGVSEGCSGHTAALPVCARMWIDGQRYLAWVFDSYPYAAGAALPGSGRFKIYGTQSGGYDITFAINYAREEPEDLMTELFLRGDLAGGVLTRPRLIESHTEVSQIGPADGALKRINSSGTIDMTNTGGPVAYSRYLGQFIEGQDFWSGSIDDNFALQTNFTNQCAQLSLGEVADVSNCDALGISVGDTPFVRFLEDTDLLIPPDFPAGPTF